MSSGILLSGGLDSIALTYWKRPDIAFTVNYGQVCAHAEIRAAKQICSELKIQHEVISVDCRMLGSGDLAGRPASQIAPVPEWWPFRNQLLITLAGMLATSLNVRSLMFASVKSDGVHADGKDEFFELINSLMSFQEGEIKIHAPAINLSTVELIRISGIDLALLAWAHSCHVANYACGNCRGCNKHRNVMSELNGTPY
jgi:7-cyano-7-deazaguanine synthase